MNNDNFLIEESDLDQARSICKYIQDPELRSKAVATTLAANIAEKYFTEVEIDIKTGIHNIGKLIENLEISDIYLNKSYVDVRLYFDNGDLTIPKYNFDNDLKPIAYMFIKIDEELSGGLVTGFILPSSVDTTVFKGDYYILSENDLVSFYDVEPLLVTPDEIDLPEDFDKKAFSLLDDNLTNPIEFYRILLSSEEAREKLATMANVQNIFSFVSFNKEQNESFEQNSTDTIEELVPEESLEIGLSQNENILEDSLIEEPLDVSVESLHSNLDSSFDNEHSELTLEEETSDESSMLIEHEEEMSLEIDDSDENFIIQEEEFILEPEHEDVELNADTSEYELLNEEEPESLIDETEIIVTDSQIIDDNNDIETEHISEHEIVSSVEDSTTNESVEENLNANFNNDQSVKLGEMDEVEESGFEYTTSVTPNLSTIENSEDFVIETEEDAELLKDLENSSYAENVSVNDASVEMNPNSKQIETLFGQEDSEDLFSKPKQKNSSFFSILGILIILAGLGGAGYYGYTKYLNPNMQPLDVSEVNNSNVRESLGAKNSDIENSETVAMPNETVENVKNIKNTNEGTSVSIPAIEQNLDASILVSNLNVYWEVPPGYVSNTSIQRYFRKLGKIIQLNLKTELLLLSKPPISNKIVVELKYNKDSQKFEVKNIKSSSGEKEVDDLILKTIESALNMNLRANTNSFKTLTGNPMLIIRL